tara:strand:+ start:9008 stop:9793 length:786 start_codon:yes stop_codon:yes gene_type:complete
MSDLEPSKHHVGLDDVEDIADASDESSTAQKPCPGSTTPKKVVRFDIDGVEVPVDDEIAPHLNLSHSSSPRKTVRFDVNDTHNPKRADTNTEAATPTVHAASATATTLFDADTSLLTPPDGPPLDFASCTSYDSPAASGSNAPPSSPSPEDTKQRTEPATFSSSCSSDPHFPSANRRPTPFQLSRPSSNTITPDNDTELSHPALEAASAGVKLLSLDEGEKDGNGQVMRADCQPCEQCGGKVVWATRGEWLLICEGCQEPQ